MRGKSLGCLWAALLILAASVLSPFSQVDPSVAVEALSRLKGMDLEANPALKTAVVKTLMAIKDRPQFVELVRDFKLTDQGPALLEFAARNPTNSAGIDAVRLLVENKQTALMEDALKGTNALPLLQALENAAEKELVPLLAPIPLDAKRDSAVRRQAVRALAATKEGANSLLEMEEKGQLPGDLKFLAGTQLNAVRWPEIKARAGKALPPPPGQNSAPLPPVAELVKRKGDPARGAEVFARQTVGCVNCHQVNGVGVDFGPQLSEIGTKLGKDALYESILDPSAGISFGYEAWQIELKNGDEAFGLIVSETADEVAVKTQNGIVTKHKKSAIAKQTKQTLSIMPAGLQQTMSTDDLVDLVEYLSTLKKR